MLLLLLLSFGVFLGGPKLHVGGLGNSLNDQVAYLSVARTFLEEGRLESKLYYPATLPLEGRPNRIYMPGHYLCLAAALAVFGDGPLAALIPSLIAAGVLVVAVYLLGLKLYDAETARLASVLLAGVPLLTVYAWTAMAELTVLAAGTLALAGLAWLPARWRAAATPLLLVLPFLFRETGALLAAPALALLVPRPPAPARWPWRRLLLCGLACVLVLSAVLALPFASRRPSLAAANIYSPHDEDPIYRDANWTPPVDVSLLEAIATKLAANVRRLPTLSALEHSVGLAWLLGLVAAALVLRREPHDPFPWAALALALAIPLLVLTLYTANQFRGARQLLLTLPCLSLVGARALLRLRPRALLIALGVALGSSVLFLGEALVRVQENDVVDALHVELAEQLELAEGEALVSPWHVVVPWIAEHPEHAAALLPADDATLAITTRELGAVTLLVPLDEFDLRYSEAGVAAAGLQTLGTLDLLGRPYLVARGGG